MAKAVTNTDMSLSGSNHEFTSTILCGETYNDAVAQFKVLSIFEVSDTVHIHIPEDVSTRGELFAISELLPDTHDMDFPQEGIVRVPDKPWVDISKSVLDVTSGSHLYRLSFIDIYTNDIFFVYFSYIIQDKDVEKPYIYMKDGVM